MTDDEARAAKCTECERYRSMAKEIRALMPSLKNAQTAEDLRLLAIRYDRLADYLVEVPDLLQDI